MNTTVFKLKNDNGLVIEFLSHGAKIKAIKVPDGDEYVDVALGYDTVDAIINGDAYMGAICGRVANRINNGSFKLDGKKYNLNKNDRTNTLHGGPTGFQTKYWQVEPITKGGYCSAYKLSLFSADGEEGFPGNLQVTIIYALNNKNEFLIDIKAQSDKKTVVNLTSHPYFNLNGVGKGRIFNHRLEINAKQFTPINHLSIPTGEILDLKGSDLDFSKPVRLGDVINSDFEPIKALSGIDHNFVLNKKAKQMDFACRLSEPESGRSIEVYTTQPGLQAYTSMHFDGTEVGKGGIPFHHYCGIAIEAQNYPDAPNQPNFPSSVLMPNDTYNEQIIYKFGF